MLDVVLSRIVQGLFSGIGIGTLFYFYPILRHMSSRNYRYKYRFNQDGKEKFNKETLKFFKLGLMYGFTYGFIVGTIIGPFGALNGI